VIRFTLHDTIIDFLRDNPDGVSSLDLAQQFLKLKSPDASMAHIAIKSILEKDQRCTFGEDQMWYAVTSGTENRDSIRLDELPWASVYMLEDPDKSRRRPMYVSIWTIESKPRCLLSSWIVDPKTIPHEEREFLLAGSEESYDPQVMDTIGTKISDLLENKIPLFLSLYHYSFLLALCLKKNILITDDTMVIGQLAKAGGIKIAGGSTNLSSCVKTFLSEEQPSRSAYKQGFQFAECSKELVDILLNRGIVTRADLDRNEAYESTHYFEGKEFSYADIVELPERPAVYGFKNKENQYVYIGKAQNVKRRILSYFRESDESPEKLQRLRAEATKLETHLCGSELESLIHEYRLIKRHSPLLNTQLQISERKGEFKELSDCIILLPHAQSDKGISIWWRANQKILIKPFNTNFESEGTITSELETFFFTDKLPAKNTDFPEQEIVYRWMSRHKDNVVVVPVYRMASAQEVYDAIKSYWDDAKQQYNLITNPPN